MQWISSKNEKSSSVWSSVTGNACFQWAAGAVQRIDHIAQHLQVDVHLLLVAPAAYQPTRLLVHGGIHHMGDVIAACQCGMAGSLVLQVQLQAAGARGQGDGAACHANRIPAG